jgi:hypothetical protein
LLVETAGARVLWEVFMGEMARAGHYCT